MSVKISNLVMISPQKLHSKSTLLFFFEGSRVKGGQGRAGSDMESLEINVQQKKRLASEETIEDFECGEQDQKKRSHLSICVPSSQVIFCLGAEPWYFKK